MKKIFLITGLFAAMSLLGQQVESGLLLHSSFDKFSTAPDYAASSQTVTSGIPQELQMRMYKDPANKLNAVMLNNKEFIGYTHQDNFNPQCGTISFWVKPVNWKMSDNQYFQTFFEVRSGDLAYRLIIYKINAANLLNVTLMNNGKQYTARIRTQWLPGEWHKVDFVWNSRSMKLYVDGVPPASGTRGEVIFKEDPAFPASIRWATLRLNYFQSWRVNPEWCTAYDDLKIYNRILSPAEILNAYEKVIPPKKAHVKLLVTSPGTVPVSVPLAGESAEGNCDSHVRISHSKDALFLDFTVGNAGAKYDIHTRDGELWQNDGVEFHLIGGDGKARQFIVNPAGALYDSMEGDPKWDSQAKVSAVRQGKNWTAHLEIPLNRLGGGQSFPVNFGVTDLSSGPRHFTWSPLSERSGFSDKRFFGTLVLGSSADRVDLISLGDLRAGQLNVDVQTAPGIRTETEYVTMSGIRGKKAQATLPEGKAEITFRAFDSAGKNIAVYSRTALVNPPINLITAAIPSENRIECRLDFSASGLHEGKILVTAKEINFGYAEAGDLWPSPMSFQIKSGERWLIQGDNGSGKTTLLKLITGQLPPRSGSLIRADFSSIYIDQEYSIVQNDRTVYEQAQAFNERHFQEHEIKTLLNRFLFPHDTWKKSCGKLSGGEKMRLAFCCLMISNQTPDLFILDEPTNNLDIQSIEIITSMIRAYRGTILLISHDAYFIRELGIHQIITTFAGRLKTNL